MLATVSLVIVALSLATSRTSDAQTSTATAVRWGVPLPSVGGVQAHMETDTPTAVTGIPDPIVEVVTSNSDTYALTSTGSVWVWGADALGEFGNGTMKSFSDHPVQVEFPAGVTIASLPSPMPYNTSLAIDTDGNIWGWGYNEDDELCLSSQILLLPTMLPLTDVTLASGAGDHMLYYSQGQLYACGGNQYGDLGDGTTTSSTTPVLVEGLPDEPVQALVSSWRNSGALMADGTYYDWGYNEAGQLGNGTTAFSTLPVLVPLRATVTDVSLGGSSGSNGQTLAILSDGSIWAWGQGGFGQLGDGLTANALSPVPVTVPVGVVFSRVLSGGSTSYAIDTTGDLWAWGENNFGQLGDGTSGSADAVLPISIGVFLTQVSSTASNVAGLSRPTPTVTVTASPEPATTGPVTYDVTVSGSGATPTGTVSVSDGNGGSCAISSLDSSGSGSCSITEPAGSYTVTATYSGDANYSPAEGTTSETVNPAAPTVTVTGLSNPATTGPVTYDVTVTGSGATPTGTVSVSDGNGGSCAISSLDSSGSGSCSITEPAGSYTVTATYSGDANYGSAVGTLIEAVEPASPTVSISESANPAALGRVTYKVTVTGVAGFTPTGSVTVSDGRRTCTIATLNTSGMGSCNIAEPAGTYTVTASYSGNANYVSATDTMSETVNKAVPSVVVSASPSPGTAGNVTYSVTVGGETRFERTGSVTVSDGTRTCTMTLSGDSGNCVITEPAGMYAVTATYSGNANYTSATGMTSESVHSARAVWDAIAGRTWDPLGFSAPEARRPE